MKRRVKIKLSCLALSAMMMGACVTNTPGRLPDIRPAFEFYNWLITESETFYDDGQGHWGQGAFGYRNMQTECFLRFDGYQLLRETDYPGANRIGMIVDEMTSYYCSIADEIGTGVWGFPADDGHPEIGGKMSVETAAGNEHNGWIIELSGTTGSRIGIYFIHGQVLADISRSYLRRRDPALLRHITAGAAWIVRKKYDYGNINYFAAALKGLAYAYAVTGDEAAKNQALTYLSVVLGSQNANGSFGSKHDQEAGYHGITLSCLAAARKYLPAADLPADFNGRLRLAVTRLRNLPDVTLEDRAGFVVQAWYYVSCLADDGLLPPLTDADWRAYDAALLASVQKREFIQSARQSYKNGYIYQKEIQTASLIGSTIVKFHFNNGKNSTVY